MGMPSVVCRENEQHILEELYCSEQAEFLALYGRRRIGKTFLIKQFFSNQEGLFFHVTGVKNGSLIEQIARFTRAVSNTFYRGSEIKERKNWLEAFEALTDAMQKHVAEDKKIVLFIDEFPWLATHKSKLLQALDYYWNHYWSHDSRVKLIICGSSASWIINKVINNKGGLHNRVTRKILLKPFTLLETKKFLMTKKINLNHWHIAQIYMLTGGVPFYLSFVKKGQSSAQVIESLAFQEDAYLINEFDNLFSSLFEDAETYVSLVTLLAKHRYGLTQAEIAKHLKKFSKGGGISKKLKDLQDAGFIRGFKSHQNKKKGVYYRVVDEYTLFYMHWILPMRNTLQETALEAGYWQELQNSSSWYSWSGYTFESIVYKHIPQVRKKIGIPVTAVANTWRYVPIKGGEGEGAQIDLLFDRRDDSITLCEIKFTKKPFIIDKSYAAQLLKKQKVFMQRTKTKKHIFIAMVSASGLQENLYADDIINGVVTLDDLFQN